MRWSLVLPSLVISACASQTPQKPDKSAGARDSGLIYNPNNSPSPSPDTNGQTPLPKTPNCQSVSGQSLALFGEGVVSLKADSITVFTSRSRETKTLCQVLLSTGKKTAVFQFAGATCTECRGEAATIRSQIQKSRYGKDIAHIVVLTDLFEDSTDQQFQTFIARYAPGALPVYDEAVLWKKLSADPTMPDRKTTMALGLNMQAIVLNHTGSVNDIVRSAETLVQAQTALPALGTGAQASNSANSASGGSTAGNSSPSANGGMNGSLGGMPGGRP